MPHARQTGGPRPTTLRVLPPLAETPAEPPAGGPEGTPHRFEPLLDALAGEVFHLEHSQLDAAPGHGPRPRAEVPAPADPSVPTAPDGPSIPEPSVPQPDEPATPAVPDEPITPIDPVPQPETPTTQPDEVPNVGF